VDGLDRTAGAIRGRSTRICGVVSAEMDNYEPGYYTGKVLYICVGFWLLAHLTHDLSHAEKKVNVVTS
jgi:hypothetical protein